MSTDDLIYHRQRAEQCRSMAALAADPGIRDRHEQLARLHAGRTVAWTMLGEQAAEPAVD